MKQILKKEKNSFENGGMTYTVLRCCPLYGLVRESLYIFDTWFLTKIRKFTCVCATNYNNYQWKETISPGRNAK